MQIGNRFSVFEWPVTQISMSSHDSMLNVSEVVQGSDLITVEYWQNLVCDLSSSPFPGVVHWASLWGRPQHWHAKGVCATPKEKERRKASLWQLSFLSVYIINIRVEVSVLFCWWVLWEVWAMKLCLVLLRTGRFYWLQCLHVIGLFWCLRPIRRIFNNKISNQFSFLQFFITTDYDYVLKTLYCSVYYKTSGRFFVSIAVHWSI